MWTVHILDKSWKILLEEKLLMSVYVETVGWSYVRTCIFRRYEAYLEAANQLVSIILWYKVTWPVGKSRLQIPGRCGLLTCWSSCDSCPALVHALEVTKMHSVYLFYIFQFHCNEYVAVLSWPYTSLHLLNIFLNLYHYSYIQNTALMKM